MDIVGELLEGIRAAIVAWWSQPIYQCAWDLAKAVALVIAAAEIGKYLARLLFGRKSRLVRIVDGLEADVATKAEEIGRLRSDNRRLGADLTEAKERLPEAALTRANREWRDNNQTRATRELEKWFEANAESVTSIALRLAKFHISRAVPDPGDHLERARDMLRLARGASPGNSEAHDISNQLDVVNAGLQEQLIRDGRNHIAWNSAMAPHSRSHGEDFLPAVAALRSMAEFCFEKGLWRLAPIFADRASELAASGGPALRPTWFAVEARAALFQMTGGHLPEALTRLDVLLAEARERLPARDETILAARFYRARTLEGLGRYKETLAEIEAFGPVQIEALSERHPNVLVTRHLRAQVLFLLGQYEEALAEIDALGPIQAEVLGGSHSEVLMTRFLRAQALDGLGRYEEALAEIDAFRPIELQTVGERHPNVLATRHLRAQVLHGLGRYEEALVEIDALRPIELEVLGERHPYVLATRYLRAQMLEQLGRYEEALAEIDALEPIRIEVLGGRHPEVLTTRCLRVEVLCKFGREDEARVEIAEIIPQLDSATDPAGTIRRWVDVTLNAIDSDPPAAAAQ